MVVQPECNLEEGGCHQIRFRKLLLFLYYLPNRHKKYWECWDFDLEHIDDVGNAYLLKFKMVLVTILNFEKQLPFLYYLTKHRQI